MGFVYYCKCFFLYPIIAFACKNMGPKKMWCFFLNNRKRKRLSKTKYYMIVKTVNRFFSEVIKGDKCLIQTTILAYLLNSDNHLVLKLGYKNQNYYRYLKLSTEVSYSMQKTDFHCWLTFNGEPVLRPFHEPFWTVLYSYEIPKKK